MSEPRNIQTIRHFLSLVTEGIPPTVSELTKALDELALAYHATPEVNASDKVERGLRPDYRKVYGVLATRFPTLGASDIADSETLLQMQQMIGDPLDALADILVDLGEVIWRFENRGESDANAELRMSFEIHWGRHLRELSLYLWAVKFWDEPT